MSRLSKAQIKAHSQACEMLEQDALSIEEREFVLTHWQESANHVNSAAGAFFTPLDMAFHLALEVRGCSRIIDLCAGIGCLAYAAWSPQTQGFAEQPEMVCVEVNPDYVAVGRKVLPEARWICASVTELPADIGQFDMAVGNPPFGRTAKIASVRYSGEDDLAVIDIASDVAEFGTFIIPQMSAPFELSGRSYYQRRPSPKFDRFFAATGIDLHAGCGVDCDTFRDQWRGVSPRVEIVTADFSEVRSARVPAQAELFGEAA